MTAGVPPAIPDLVVTDSPDPSARAAIAEALTAFNAGFLGASDMRPLAILIGDGPDTEGGLWGRTSYGWLFVELLFVPERLRAQGMGTRLLAEAEAEARRRGCRGAWLDSFNPGAVAFYGRHGYRPFGRIDGYPPGHARQFLAKAL